MERKQWFVWKYILQFDPMFYYGYTHSLHDKTELGYVSFVIVNFSLTNVIDFRGQEIELKIIVNKSPVSRRFAPNQETEG